MTYLAHRTIFQKEQYYPGFLFSCFKFHKNGSFSNLWINVLIEKRPGKSMEDSFCPPCHLGLKYPFNQVKDEATISI